MKYRLKIDKGNLNAKMSLYQSLSLAPLKDIVQTLLCCVRVRFFLYNGFLFLTHAKFIGAWCKNVTVSLSLDTKGFYRFLCFVVYYVSLGTKGYLVSHAFIFDINGISINQWFYALLFFSTCVFGTKRVSIVWTGAHCFTKDKSTVSKSKWNIHK